MRERLIRTSFTRRPPGRRGSNPLGDPALEDVSFEDGQPLKLQDVPSRFCPSSSSQDYREIEVRRSVPNTQVTDADVDQALEELQAVARPARVRGRTRGRPRAIVVIADVEGHAEEGEAFSRERMQIEVGARNNLPAFNEHLAGAEEGRGKRSFPSTIPKGYQGRNLAGKRVEFRLEVHEVKRRELPELDDEFAKDLGEFGRPGRLEDLGSRRTCRRARNTRRRT